MGRLANLIAGAAPHHVPGLTGSLVYYAYKDLVKFRIPRTANEMYHLRDASPVDRGELESGDLVFFRTQGRGTADHVGVCRQRRNIQSAQRPGYSDHLSERRLLGTPLRRRASRDDAENIR
jgi:cell wall-associated NlpC family hydrolase